MTGAEGPPVSINKGATPRICAACGVPAFLGSWGPDGVIRYFCHQHAPELSEAERLEWTKLLGPGDVV